MPYSVDIGGLDFSSGVASIRVTAGYTWTEVGGPKAVERRQDEVTTDFTNVQFQPGPATFSYAGDLAPQPKPSWYIALWVQEVARVSRGDGWLFRSGRFTTEPPTDPLELILAPEVLIGAAELTGAVGTLPMTSGSTTLTAVTLTVTGADIAINAVGTDTRLPAGVTFTYTAMLTLIPNGSLQQLDSPFEIGLANGSLSFTGGTGQGLLTVLLNAVSGIIEADAAPRIHATVKSAINSGVLSEVATRLNRGVPASMPAGVVLSVRAVRATTRPLAGGAESVIGVSACLGGFGGVLNKFPATAGGTRCFIATAAVGADAPEVALLRTWRDTRLRRHGLGRGFIALYERLSPPLARRIAGSTWRRAVARVLVVTPAAAAARLLLRGDPWARTYTDPEHGSPETPG